MTIKIGDVVTWQKREPGKMYLGMAGLTVNGFGGSDVSSPA